MSPLTIELPLVWESEQRLTEPAACPAGSDRRGTAAPDAERGARAASADPGGEPSLDRFLSGMWEGLAAHRSVTCPLCDGELKPDYGAHALPIGGRCQDCETRLS